MIVFGIDSNIFIVLPVWLKTCRSNGVFFCRSKCACPKNRVRFRGFACPSVPYRHRIHNLSRPGYNYVKPKYGEKSTLCYIDTGSFISPLKIDDIYEDILKEDLTLLVMSWTDQSLNSGFAKVQVLPLTCRRSRDGEDLWQWSWLEIRLNIFCRSTIRQK